MSVLLHESGRWTISLQANQNPVNPRQILDVTTAQPKQLFTDHLQRNEFHIVARCYSQYGNCDSNGLLGKPLVFPLLVKPFMVQRQQPYALFETVAQLRAVDPSLFPGIVKTTHMGYDGKGQASVDDPTALMTRSDKRVFFWSDETTSDARSHSDTVTLIGSEIYMADLSFYQNVRQASKRGMPGSNSIYNDLRERYVSQEVKSVLASD